MEPVVFLDAYASQGSTLSLTLKLYNILAFKFLNI